ncbi:bifunctional nicotinamidase/pyrazinamidase [Vibrio salinus]|uniref:bifunctional nicotinamidase/pyrazinamidase n=1 Tax=Vibrio salinus TaxID=2899784 RepID=UPI001E3D8FF1|nr:bifunctional nicotinamidase/pyrazinamidase [Vibrio salinus]MCE0492586.1 bifunctional nicotinamidase/pyrazinamidase [Vibrio salinus]
MSKALLLVDIQNDFSPSGTLPVPDGDEIVPVINNILDQFDYVVATLDWHPENHGSFASQYTGKKPGDVVNLSGTEQILWPMHCVQNSEGAKFIPTLNTASINHIVHKGTHPDVDSYSGFYDNQKRHMTGLAKYLKSNAITDVYVVGLAADYCVKFTALDAVAAGFNTFVIKDATRGVNVQDGDVDAAFSVMENAGCKIIQSEELKGEK